MTEKNKYWVTLIVLMWMSITQRVLGHSESTKWALLVAGSSGYDNYRHQADVCHAYQILKKGGLKDENIIVFMYDDIAFHPENPRPGVIINHPNGSDVYHGVPKDYIGNEGNEKNFFAVLSGNKSAVKGGSGKVLNSGPNDTIFIYYVDHGTTGYVNLPDDSGLYDIDFVNALKKKHEAKSYKKMVIYMEACKSGSMFRYLPNDINIYVTTASDAFENSYAYYCPETTTSPPLEYNTCIGDLYSISWMEDSNLLFGKENGSTMMHHVRAPGQPLVDDWDCFKTLIKTYEGHCSSLSIYGRKYFTVFANMCNAGISVKQMVAAATQACLKKE